MSVGTATAASRFHDCRSSACLEASLREMPAPAPRVGGLRSGRGTPGAARAGDAAADLRRRCW